MKRFFQPVRAVVMATLMASVATPAFAQLADAIETGEKATRSAEQTQERINQLDDERSDMIREFRTLLQQKDAAELYARQQERVVASQVNEIESFKGQLERVEEIKVQMVPMMQDMLSALQAFRAADVPFKQKSESGVDVRAARYENLNTVLDRADVSAAEQYRLIIEAYQAEMEYGRTIDTYLDEIELADGTKLDVDVFRYGRVALVYVTKDRKNLGRWDNQAKQWVDLPSSYKDDILKGIRIANKVASAEVLTGPVTPFAVQ